MLLQLGAGMREHALVLRRTHAARAAQDEGYWAAVLRSGLVLEGVGLHSGQSGFILRRVPITLGMEPVHLECRGDDVHEHRKCAQHSCQQELRKLRGYQPSVCVFVPCHGLENNPRFGPG